MMLLNSSRLLWSIRSLAMIVLGLSALCNLNAQNATAPTASEDPAIIDQAWQKASSKYDPQRAALLKEVDGATHQGPFRPDWESLQKYEAPRVVQGREIWNLHSLGRLFRPRVRQRVVSTQHVS